VTHRSTGAPIKSRTRSPRSLSSKSAIRSPGPYSHLRFCATFSNRLLERFPFTFEKRHSHKPFTAHGRRKSGIRTLRLPRDTKSFTNCAISLPGCAHNLEAATDICELNRCSLCCLRPLGCIVGDLYIEREFVGRQRISKVVQGFVAIDAGLSAPT